MSRTRPFLTGAAVSAAAMYFSLQYHVVRSDAGLRILPRIPQHSLALAWADVRTWTPSQWTDRVELARAAMAAGASDLIADSVRVPLQQEVADSASTLNDLRDFLNRSRQNVRQSPGKISEARRPEIAFDTPHSDVPDPEPSAAGDMLSVAGRSVAGTEETELSLDHEEISVGDAAQLHRQSVPLPTEAPGEAPADPFRTRSGEVAVARPSRFSAEDIRSGLASVPNALVPDAANALLQQAEEMERKIFGDVSGKASGSIQPHATAPRSPVAELEQSARNLIKSLGNSGSDPSSASPDDKPWIRQPVATFGSAAKFGMAEKENTVGAASAAPDAAGSPAPATVEGEEAETVFDPFLEADSR